MEYARRYVGITLILIWNVMMEIQIMVMGVRLYACWRMGLAVQR